MLNLYERQIVCVCESCWALRSGEPEFRPTGNRTLWLEDFRLPEEIWAQFRIPIGLAFFMHSSVTKCVVALYPSPAGATESELHFETWNRLAEMNPVLKRPRAGRGGADRQPDGGHAGVRDRADRPLLHARRSRQGAWEGISGGSGVEQAIEGYFDDLRAVARMSQPETLEVPVAPEPEFQVLGATGRRHAAVPALEFDVHVSEPGGRQVHAIALSAQIMIEPARRGLRRRDAREARRAVRRHRSAGRRPRAASSGTRPTCSCRRSRGRRPSACAVPASFDMEVASAKYLYGLPDGEVPLAFNFNGTVHYRGDDGRLQMSLVPWACTAEFRFPVSIWRELIEHYYPQTRLGPAPGGDPSGAPAREGAARRCRRSTRAWRSCWRRA